MNSQDWASSSRLPSAERQKASQNKASAGSLVPGSAFAGILRNLPCSVRAPRRLPSAPALSPAGGDHETRASTGRGTHTDHTSLPGRKGRDLCRLSVPGVSSKALPAQAINRPGSRLETDIRTNCTVAGEKSHSAVDMGKEWLGGLHRSCGTSSPGHIRNRSAAFCHLRGQLACPPENDPFSILEIDRRRA